MMNWAKLREHLLPDTQNDQGTPRLAIPPLPAVAMEFCRAADRPDVSVVELSSILDRDAGLVLELLRTVNSAAMSVRNKVNSSRAALGLLGIRRAKMFVLTTSVQSVASKSKSPLADSRRFAFASMQRAVFARRLADRLGHDADLAFAAALLQDFAVPALTVESPERYRTLMSNLSDDVKSLAELEQKRFGWDHALVGARLMLSWKFPDDLLCLVLAHHRLDAILGSNSLGNSELVEVAIASLLPDPLDTLPSRQQLLEHLLTTRFGIEVKSFQEWVNEDLQYTGVACDPTLAWQPRDPDAAKSGVRPGVPVAAGV